VLVGTVANLRATKGYPDLLKAAQIVSRRSRHVQFVAAGQGPLADDLARTRDDLGLAGRFDFLGYRRDVHRVLAALDIFVLASHHEGLPIALLEALALGVPVVATSVGGIPEAVTDGREALLVPPGQPDRLASALESLIASAELRGALAAAASTRAESFDGAVAVARVEAIYRDALATTA
jgi:glycosyltransferase involved in cell wall biosynthesis